MKTLMIPSALVLAGCMVQTPDPIPMFPTGLSDSAVTFQGDAYEVADYVDVKGVMRQAVPICQNYGWTTAVPMTPLKQCTQVSGGQYSHCINYRHTLLVMCQGERDEAGD